MITWNDIERWVPTVLVVAAIVGGLWWIRRQAFVGLGEIISGPPGTYSRLAAELDNKVRDANQGLRNRCFARIQKTVHTTQWTMPAAILSVLLALMWIAVTGLYVSRNARIVQVQEARADLERGIAPDPFTPITALAEVLTPILLTAVVGILLAELVGFTRHVSYIQKLTKGRHRRIAFGFAAFLFVGAGLMQFSVAEQEKAQAFTTVQLLTGERLANLPTPPSEATASRRPERQVQYEQAVAAFNLQTDAELREYESTIGPLGWRTLLPFGAIIADALFSWALIDGLIIVVAASASALSFVVRAITGLHRGLAYAVSLFSAVVLRILNCPFNEEREAFALGARQDALERTTQRRRSRRRHTASGSGPGSRPAGSASGNGGPGSPGRVDPAGSWGSSGADPNEARDEEAGRTEPESEWSTRSDPSEDPHPPPDTREPIPAGEPVDDLEHENCTEEWASAGTPPSDEPYYPPTTLFNPNEISDSRRGAEVE